MTILEDIYEEIDLVVEGAMLIGRNESFVRYLQLKQLINLDAEGL